ncbi:MAG: hypothetical protein JSV49_06420 [Thermoplasmata archaeon]|nr:MAG: hypothetical protein JSV49_06420 [Thermoplasmata archaeon]
MPEFESEDDRKIKLNAVQVRSILTALKKQRKIRENAVIAFHNDSDGLCSALYTKQILRDLKYVIEPEDLLPLTHLERDKLEIDENKIYFFLDIQPPKLEENIFCVDHHIIDDRNKFINKNMLIYRPESIEYEFISTATFLSMYVRYVQQNYRFNFSRFIDKKVWWDNEFDRYVALFVAVADNIWLLSKYSPTPLLKELIDEANLTERKLIKESMGISLLLGRDMDRMKGFSDLLDKPLNLLEISQFDGIVAPRSKEIDNLYKFARDVDREAQIFVTEQNEQIDQAISLTERELERNHKTISDYMKAMPINLKKDMGTVMEMLKTVGDRDKAKWKQIEFYGKEIDRLEIHVKSLETKLKSLKDRKVLIIPDNVPGICVFISKQSSEQVKGIMSSLLYYFGQKNIVVEESEHYAIWGARGFNKDFLENELMTLIFDKRVLASYRRLEDMSKDLPSSYRRSLNISHNITMDTKYVGGMGGRGLVFGGNISGKVPQLFAILEISGFEEKIQELIAHGELSSAIKGLTEGQSEVNTVNALRTKFKSLGWVTIQVIGGPGTGDILSGEIGVPIAWLAGANKDVNLSIKSPIT